MAKITLTVCEVCSENCVPTDRWLKLLSMDVRYGDTNDALVQSDADLDFCSPGCLMRYLAKRLEPATNGHALSRQEREQVAVAGINPRAAA